MEFIQSQLAVRLQVENTSNVPPDRNTRRLLAGCRNELNQTLAQAREMLEEVEHIKSGNAMERFKVLMVEHLIEDLEVITRGLQRQ